jgi:hypothetical protein
MALLSRRLAKETSLKLQPEPLQISNPNLQLAVELLHEKISPSSKTMLKTFGIHLSAANEVICKLLALPKSELYSW